MGEDRLSVIIRRGTEDDIEGIRRLEKLNLDNVQPGKTLWTALSGTGRNAMGPVCADNVRLE